MGEALRTLDMNLYCITFVDGQAELHGPYPDDEERLRVAGHFFFGATMGRDAILRLDIDDEGVPIVKEYDIRLIDPLAVVRKTPKFKVFRQ
jgi:hypothetical protein